MSEVHNPPSDSRLQPSNSRVEEALSMTMKSAGNESHKSRKLDSNVDQTS